MMPMCNTWSRASSLLVIVVVALSFAGCGAGPAPSISRPYFDQALAAAGLNSTDDNEAALTVLVAIFDRRGDLRAQFGDRDRMDLRSLLQWAMDTVDDDAPRLGPHRERYLAIIHAMDTAALARTDQGGSPTSTTLP